MGLSRRGWAVAPTVATPPITCCLALVAMVAIGCPAAPPQDKTLPATAVEPWYRKATALDLTGDGQPDTVRLEAHGVRPDSLQIDLLLLVAGQEKHRESWLSSYEVALVDSTARAGPRLADVLRQRLDTVLARVKVERLDGRGVRLMAEDSAALQGVVPRPTHRISVAYGYETTVRLVWDASKHRFVRLWSCC